MKIKIEGIDYQVPNPSRFLTIFYGLKFCYRKMFIWRQLVSLSPEDKHLLPYSYRRKSLILQFYAFISHSPTERLFIQYHESLWKSKIINSNCSVDNLFDHATIKVALFFKLSHVKIRFNLIKLGFFYLILNFFKWRQLVELHRFSEDYPEMFEQIDYNREKFFESLSLTVEKKGKIQFFRFNL